MAKGLVVKGACKQAQYKNSKSSHKKICGCCGITELWYLSMIQCSACQQWFHEGCVKDLSKPLLYGDCFYIFVCSSCNFSVEYVGRLQLTWLELVHLVLFHLMLKYRGGYYDLDVEILPWVKDHWEALQTGLMNSVSDEERRKEFLDILKSNPNRFRCGGEVRKRVSWWGLRVCCPPTAPKYQLHKLDTVLTHSTVNQILASESRFIDRKTERLQRVTRVHLKFPHEDEYYEKWTMARSQYKRRKRKTGIVSLPKRKAALECREKCKIMANGQYITEMPVNKECKKRAKRCISKRKVDEASSPGTSPQVDKGHRSSGMRSGPRCLQTLESDVEGMPSASKRLREQPSSQIRQASQKSKRGKKTTVDKAIVVKKRKRGRPRLGGSEETVFWTHHLMAGVKDMPVELHSKKCTQREFTVLMARRSPFYSRTVDDVREYFRDTSNLSAREECRVMGKRVSPEGLVQYLVVKNEPVQS